MPLRGCGVGAIVILSVAKDLLLAQQQILRRLRLLRMTAPANRVTLAKLGHHRPLGSGSGSGLPTTRPSVVEFVNTAALQGIYPAFPGDGGYAPASRARKQLGEVCWAFDSHVDQAFPVEVLLIFTPQKFLGAG